MMADFDDASLEDAFASQFNTVDSPAPAAAPPVVEGQGEFPGQGGEGGGDGLSPLGATPDPDDAGASTSPSTSPLAEDIAGSTADPEPAPATPTPPVDEGGATDVSPPPEVDDGPHVQIVDGGPDIPDPSADPSTPPPTPDSVDVGALLSGYLQRDPTVDDARALVETLDFVGSLQSLPPDAQQAIMQIVSTGRVPSSPPPPVQGATPPPAPPPERDPWDDDPAPPAPSVPPEVERELAEMRAWREQQEQARAAQEQQWMAGEMRAGADEFLSAPPAALSSEELVLLERQATQSGRFANHFQATGNPRLAWKRTLEETFWADPVYRQRVVESEAAARREQQEQELERQRRAASVSAGGGVVPSPVEFTPPKDMADAASRMSGDIEALFNHGSPSSG